MWRMVDLLDKYKWRGRCIISILFLAGTFVDEIMITLRSEA